MTIFKIHPFYWLMAFICSITGLFKYFLYFSLLIIIHEFGHFIASKFFLWKVKKIVILPFGGITIFNEVLSKSIFEEFIILIFGPLFQICFYFLYTSIFGYNEIIALYNYSLLIFNMLPIYPLDGYKFINLLFNKFFSFKFSHLFSIIISLICILILLFITIFYRPNFIMILALILLFYKNIKEFIDHNLVFNKFLLERYLYNICFKKSMIIESNNLSKMKRDYRHLFHFNKKYETEKEILNKRFIS